MDLYLETPARLADGAEVVVDAVALDRSTRRATHVVVRVGRAQRRFMAPIGALAQVGDALVLSWTTRHLRRHVGQVEAGEVQLNRDSVVTSADDLVVGHLDALGLNDTREVTHMVVDSGYLWTQRTLRIPAAALASVGGNRIALRERRAALSRYLPLRKADRPCTEGLPRRPRGEPRPALRSASH